MAPKIMRNFPGVLHSGWDLQDAILLARIMNRASLLPVVAAGPLNMVAALALSIINLSRRTRAAQRSCRALAEKCTRLAFSLAEATFGGESPSEQLLHRVNEILQLLRGVDSAMSNLIHRRLRWFERWRVTYIEEDLKDYDARITEALAMFMTGAIIDIYKHTTQLVASPPQNELETEVEEIRRADVLFEECMGPNSDGIPVYRGKLRRNGVRVIIKEYRNTPRQQFLKDLDRLYPVVHPNLPMVIAKSVDKEPIPYVLLEYAASGSARLYLKKQIAGDPLASIIACIRLISDVMSALQYIVNSNRFEAYDIENCTDVSRYSITGDRKVLIGQDLVTRNPLKTSIIPENQSLATWLKAKAWFIVMDLLYGGANVIDWTNWDTIRTTAPHLRPILTMVTFKCPSFDTMVSRFRSVVHEINLREDELTYKDIRQAIVSLPSLVPTYMYKPPVPLDVVVGDIGYMHGGQFIRLGSIRPSIRKISPLPEYILTTPDVTSREESEGVIRREIRAAHYAEIARWGESEYVEDVQTYWEFFVAATRSLFSELGPEHDGVRVSDLILGDDLFV